MRSIALFNHKGGVGKTTLTTNIAGGLVDNGKRVLIVDADPQCNISSFFLPESKLDEILGESNEASNNGTIWSAVKPVVEGTGDVISVPAHRIAMDGMMLVVGDVMLSTYEEELPAAWTDSFARKPRGYAVMSALVNAAQKIAHENDIDIILYDVGPNVGPLNRSILLGCDGFITPVAPDLFSLRALSSVGTAVHRWIEDWKTVQLLAPKDRQADLLKGNPSYLGYIISAFKAAAGAKSKPQEFWEAKISPRVKTRVIDVLKAFDESLVLPPPHKIGDVKHYQSIASIAQEKGLPIGWLSGHINNAYASEISSAKSLFKSLAKSVIDRVDQAIEKKRDSDA